MNKKKLRENVKKKLEEYKQPIFNQLTERVLHNLYHTTEWKNAATIGVTFARNREIPTFSLINKAWEEGKIVCLPRCNPVTKQMNFRKFTHEDELETIYFGLKEPIELKTELIQPQDIDLLIVPGVCFNKSGFRIGYGGGYYDRYLADFQGITLSLGLSCQLVDDLPIEDHDIPVRKIITEHEVISCQ
ncbi:5-formyltetrahydrofolate cyclo-ligase [Metabacillus arenae]|uniref:5-formyltetrahydrofolate cyclo-ligase n=1 Tax=Metabacillus arenae TaxID=2771434 RepID=A0A926RW75_9BACI|nr:5-formyltetrahydrofolate cyclo-ligase [Metabacillus arenae]MBD1378887.1 5-formyltetrahydrofolate cyclo-ligase [Metabacillus arenae]